ncbi:hypothetical protein ABEB36_001162 [Hypothenemus hampei]|uniref:Uncharacterized protein n=1 Tax=Hypothenemus hampei TaxID=57062 RepID=A0ABD1FDN7_HYPHA
MEEPQNKQSYDKTFLNKSTFYSKGHASFRRDLITSKTRTCLVHGNSLSSANGFAIEIKNQQRRVRGFSLPVETCQKKVLLRAQLAMLTRFEEGAVSNVPTHVDIEDVKRYP